MNYLKNNLKICVNSFKNKNILLVLLMNLLFVIINIIFVGIIKVISQPQIEKIDIINLSRVLSQNEAQLEGIINTLRGFVIFAVLMGILFILLLIINWSLCQGIIYNILLKKGFNFKYFERFLLLNIVWLIPWWILGFVLLFGGKIGFLITPIMVLLLLFLHFSFILYILFTENNKIKQILQSLKIGITKMHYFILPYIIIVIMFIIISQLNLLKLPFFIIGLVYLLFFSWVQNYTKEVILELV